MPLRFHQSLNALVEAAEKAEVPLDERTVVIRDGAGRLILAREGILNASELERALKNALNGYAGPIVVITGTAAARLVSDPTAVSVEVTGQNGTKHVVKYADRRIVGADWLQAPVAPSKWAPRLVFGSLKGGVGRSTALTVLAAELARHGRRVLVFDLDLEAPGIGSMLLSASDDTSLDRRPRYGVIDYLLENGLGGIPDEELYDFVGVSPFHDGSIEVIPAVGRETETRPETMIAKLSRALVEDRDGDQTLSVSRQIGLMVDRFVRHRTYDAILIDARAGLAEITAAPLLGLGAELLLFGTDQQQTFQGYSYFLAHLAHGSDFAHMSAEMDWRNRIAFVQAKAPAAAAKRATFRSKLYELCAANMYETEQLDPQGRVVMAEFNPAPDETGQGVPHDALHIQYHPDYDAFDPVDDRTQLDPEVYKGPFGSFLQRALEILNLTPETSA